MCNLIPEVRDTSIGNIVEKRGAISPLFHNILLSVVKIHIKTGTRFLLRDKRLFEISEVEITTVDCRLNITYSIDYQDGAKLHKSTARNRAHAHTNTHTHTHNTFLSKRHKSENLWKEIVS